MILQYPNVRLLFSILIIYSISYYPYVSSLDNDNINNENTESQVSTSSSAPSNIDPSILPFFIGSDSSNTLQVTSHDNLVQCEIYYDTQILPLPLTDTDTPSSTNVLDSINKNGVDTTTNNNGNNKALFDEEVQQLISDLQDKCINHDADGFIYEICFGGRIRQRGRNSDPNNFDYTVGTYHDGDTKRYIRSRKTNEQPISLFFTKGDKCGEPDPLRRAEVSLHCGPNFMVVNGEERSMCNYYFAITHPTLCKRKDVFSDFIPPLTKYIRDNNNNNNNNNIQDINPLDLVHSLPISIQQQLLKISKNSNHLLYNALNKAIQDNQEKEEHPTTGLSEADVAGTGGKSIGIDDHERHGGHWTGVTPGGSKDSVSSWFMELHPLWPDILIENDHDEEEDNNKAGKSYRTEWTCTALSTDDLRKGIETTTLTAATPTFISLSMKIPKSLTIWNTEQLALMNSKTEINLRNAIARSSNRQFLPAQIQTYEDNDYYKVVLSVTAVELPAKENIKDKDNKDTKAEKEENSKTIMDINYVSLTVQVTEI